MSMLAELDSADVAEEPVFAIEYEFDGARYRTIVSAPSARAAENLFRRQNPHVKTIGVVNQKGRDERQS